MLCRREFPLDQFPSLPELCFSAIKRFSFNCLRSAGRGLSAAAEIRPVEAQYQDELYRACYITLGHNVHLTSEWTGSLTSGRVDFQIKSVKWAIECVREADRLEQHIARFLLGGKYHRWISSGEIREYILLDFRTSKPVKIRGTFILILYLFILNANS